MSSFRFRFKRLLRKHERWLTFAGAFIVFVTFVFKEGLGESWRHTAESIDMAQYVYGIRQSTTNLQKGVDALGQRLDDSLVPHRRSDFNDFSEAFESMEQCRRIISNGEITIANLDILANSLPSSDAYREEAETLHNALDVRRKELTPLDEELATLFISSESPAPSSGYKSEQKQAIKHFASKVDAQWKSLNRFQVETFALQKELLNHAEEMRKEHTIYSTYAWWVTAILFAIGWGLGIVSKIYGVKDVETKD
jgi:hypothetical protein